MVRYITLDSQIAKEFNAPLVSLDGGMTKRAKLVVKIANIEDMVIS
jgi:hypothetical protein